LEPPAAEAAGAAGGGAVSDGARCVPDGGGGGVAGSDPELVEALKGWLRGMFAKNSDRHSLDDAGFGAMVAGIVDQIDAGTANVRGVVESISELLGDASPLELEDFFATQ
jgi:hypothetical protein